MVKSSKFLFSQGMKTKFFCFYNELTVVFWLEAVKGIFIHIPSGFSLMAIKSLFMVQSTISHTVVYKCCPSECLCALPGLVLPPSRVAYYQITFSLQLKGRKMVIQRKVTNSQEAFQVSQTSCFHFCHHWLMLVTGKHLILTDAWCYLPWFMLLSEKFLSLVAIGKLMYRVLVNGTRLFSKTVFNC